MDENATHRKLTAILSADVNGYSRLMGDDDVSTVNTITAYRQIISGLMQKHHGRVVDTPGDNILAEFGSALNAVNGAIDIQRTLEIENSKLPVNRRMVFRIGINVGDILHKDNCIYGDGVNVAARIESLADPGGICISRGVFEQVKRKIRQGFEYLGAHPVKNISEPVNIYRILLAPEDEGKLIGEPLQPAATSKKTLSFAIAVIFICSAAILWMFFPKAPDIAPASQEKMAYPLPAKPSIAVLPFDNMSGDPEQEYFCDGLTEEIITALSKVPKVFVIARNSVFTYKGKAVKVNQVAEELGIRYVLEGSVRKGGDKLRITAQLTDAVSGHHLWAERYDRDLKDIFAVQDELTKKIITAMQVELTWGEQARGDAKGTENLQAYLKFLQAREFGSKLNIEANAKGRQLAQEAIELDPQYAMPYRILAATYRTDVLLGTSKSPKESMARCIELLRKAIELDDTYAEAYGALGFTLSLMGQHEKAVATAEEAVVRDPNSATSYAMLGHTLRMADRPKQAIQAYTKAIRLNPIPPTFYQFGLGMSYSLDGQYEKGIQWCITAVKQNPDDFFARLMLTAAYSMAGTVEKAHAEAREVLRINPKYSLAKSEKRAKIKYKDKWFAALRKAGLPEYPPTPAPEKPSIAVLPFVNMSGDPDQEYFSDGITEHIITSLSKVPYLIVIARHSSFSFKNKAVTVQDIAEELGVQYILEGSVQRSGGRVRITSQLIDAKAGHHLWADTYDRKSDDIFSLQDEIAIKLMAELQLELTVEELGRLSATKTTNIKAYEKFLMASDYLFRRTEEDSRQAKMLTEEAINIDPEYGAAYQLMARVYFDDYWNYKTASPEVTLDKAEQMIRKSIDLHGQDATSHYLLGILYFLRRQYDEAVVECQKAIALSPNSAEVHYRYAQALRYAGRFEEAILHFKKAIRLNPITPMTYMNNLAWAYAFSEQYEKAIPIWREAIERNPDYFFAYLGLAMVYQLTGDEHKARDAAAEVRRLKPQLTVSMIAKGPATKNWDRERGQEALRRAGIPE